MFLVPLGEYIAPSYKVKWWTMNKEGTTLHLEMIMVDDSSWFLFLMYDPSTTSQTWSWRKFMQSYMLQHDPLPFYASVIQISDNSVLLRSWIKGYEPQKKSTSFWGNIRSYGNPSIYAKFCDATATDHRYGKACTPDHYLLFMTVCTWRKNLHWYAPPPL